MKLAKSCLWTTDLELQICMYTSNFQKIEQNKDKYKSELEAALSPSESVGNHIQYCHKNYCKKVVGCKSTILIPK